MLTKVGSAWVYVNLVHDIHQHSDCRCSCELSVHDIRMCSFVHVWNFQLLSVNFEMDIDIFSGKKILWDKVQSSWSDASSSLDGESHIQSLSLALLIPVQADSTRIKWTATSKPIFREYLYQILVPGTRGFHIAHRNDLHMLQLLHSYPDRDISEANHENLLGNCGIIRKIWSFSASSIQRCLWLWSVKL